MFPNTMDNKHQMVNPGLLSCTNTQTQRTSFTITSSGWRLTLLHVVYLSKPSQYGARVRIVHLVGDGLELGGRVVCHGGLGVHHHCLPLSHLHLPSPHSPTHCSHVLFLRGREDKTLDYIINVKQIGASISDFWHKRRGKGRERGAERTPTNLQTNGNILTIRHVPPVTVSFEKPGAAANLGRWLTPVDG